MRTRITYILVGAGIATALGWPIMSHHNQGPAIRIADLKPEGPARAGGSLAFSVNSSIQDGCIPATARMIWRWYLTPQGKMHLVEQGLTNIPLIAGPVKTPLVNGTTYPTDPYKTIVIPLPMGLDLSDRWGVPIGPWNFKAEYSPLACGIYYAAANLFGPQNVSSGDVPIQLMPAIPVGEK